MGIANSDGGENSPFGVNSRINPCFYVANSDGGENSPFGMGSRINPCFYVVNGVNIFTNNCFDDRSDSELHPSDVFARQCFDDCADGKSDTACSDDKPDVNSHPANDATSASDGSEHQRIRKWCRINNYNGTWSRSSSQ